MNMTNKQLGLLFSSTGLFVTTLVIVTLNLNEPEMIEPEPCNCIPETVYVYQTEFSACEEGLITPYGDTIPYPER